MAVNPEPFAEAAVRDLVRHIDPRHRKLFVAIIRAHAQAAIDAALRERDQATALVVADADAKARAAERKALVDELSLASRNEGNKKAVDDFIRNHGRP